MCVVVFYTGQAGQSKINRQTNKQTNKQSPRLDKDSKTESMLFALGGMRASIFVGFFFKTRLKPRCI